MKYAIVRFKEPYWEYNHTPSQEIIDLICSNKVTSCAYLVNTHFTRIVYVAHTRTGDMELRDNDIIILMGDGSIEVVPDTVWRRLCKQTKNTTRNDADIEGMSVVVLDNLIYGIALDTVGKVLQQSPYHYAKVESGEVSCSQIIDTLYNDPYQKTTNDLLNNLCRVVDELS